MTLHINSEDQTFKRSIEACKFPVSDFNHAAHIRLAYIYLIESPNTEAAISLMKSALTNLLLQAGVEPSTKYHETLTRAWVYAVYHFMQQTKAALGSDSFVEQHQVLMNSKIMLSHYSHSLLYSEAARAHFVEPDIDPIPRYATHRSHS